MTSRTVCLVLPTLAAAAQMFACVDAERERLRRWLPWVDKTQSEADSATFLQFAIDQRAANASQIWLIEVDGEFAGVIDLHAICRLNNRAAIGYWLSARFEGQGVISAAVRLLLAEAFGPQALNRVVIDAAAANLRSCAVAERLGFQFEGVMRQYLRYHGEYYDGRQYSLLASEWRELTCK